MWSWYWERVEDGETLSTSVRVLLHTHHGYMLVLMYSTSRSINLSVVLFPVAYPVLAVRRRGYPCTHPCLAISTSTRWTDRPRGRDQPSSGLTWP